MLGQYIAGLENFLQASTEKKIALDEKKTFFARVNADPQQMFHIAEEHWSGDAGSHVLLVDIECNDGKAIKTLFCESRNRFNTPNIAHQPTVLWWTFPLFLPSSATHEVKKTERMKLLLQWSIARWGQSFEKKNQNWIMPQPRGLLWKSTVSEVWIYGFALDISLFERTASKLYDMQALWHSCQSAWLQIQPWFENNE